MCEGAEGRVVMAVRATTHHHSWHLFILGMSKLVSRAVCVLGLPASGTRCGVSLNGNEGRLRGGQHSMSQGGRPSG